MRINRKAVIISTVILCAVLLLCQTGCRLSTVLDQVMYDLDSGQIDQNNNTQANDNNINNTDKDDDLSAQQDDSGADTKRGQENTGAVKGDHDNSQTADDVTHDDQAEGDQDADDKDSASSQSTSSTSSGTGTSSTPDEKPTPKTLDSQVYDPVTGKVVKIPTNVKTVAAVGDAASYVIMLGGSGRLAATSTSVKSGPVSSLLGNINDLWKGNGDVGISSENFKTLTNTVYPDVCFVIDGQATFSDDQILTLGDYTIPVVHLPPLTTKSNRQTATDTIAKVLVTNTSTGEACSSIASSYWGWYDNITNTPKSYGVENFNYNNTNYDSSTGATKETGTTSGFYSLYISDWDGSATYTVKSNTTQVTTNSGAAVVPAGYTNSPLSYYMSQAGVVNTAATYNAWKCSYWYVNPITTSACSVIISGKFPKYDTDTSDSDKTRILTSIAAATNGSDSFSAACLGDASFPAVIVSSHDVKGDIENDAALEYGLWKACPYITYNNVSFWGYTVYGLTITSSIHNVTGSGYAIHVNPKGLFSWAGGSAESPLETLWVAKTYYPSKCDKIDLSKAVEDFYSRYYHLTITPDQAATILAGP